MRRQRLTMKIVKTYDEAVEQLNKWKDNGWKTIILPVK